MNQQETITRFYQSFERRDWQAMQECYDDAVVFSDPVFLQLSGGHAKAMWHMLTTAAKDLTVTFGNVRVDGESGSCDWEARYSFSRTGRPVHNRIHADFRFAGDKIIRHTDTFDLARWAGMALGWPGKILGWSPWMQNRIRATADAGLHRFLKTHPEYGAIQNQPSST